MTGNTFDKLLLQKERKPLKAGLKTLFDTLEDIWQQTRVEKIHAANYMQQLDKRLNNLYKGHPDFNLKGLQIGDMKQATLEKLVKQASKVERKQKVPQAVYIHGDFNIDNILYDSVQQHISFIDLHRSEYLDYVQDLLVLMISFYRITNFDPEVRKLIRLAMEAIYDFGQSYAEQIQDEDYSLRMALGLGRSFIISTRFVLDKEHAKSMHFKGRYLIEQVISFDKANRKNMKFQRKYSMTDLKISVVGIPGKWSTEVLADAIEAKTGFRLVIDIQQVVADLNKPNVMYKDHSLCQLDGILIKKISQVYSPTVIDHLEILRFVEKCGVKIYSKPSEIIRLVDRMSCTISLAKANIPMPPTLITENLDQAYKAVQKFGTVVLKPLFSTKARGMLVLDDSITEHELKKIRAVLSATGIFSIYNKNSICPGKTGGSFS